MRQSLLWPVALLLASASLVSAQESASSPPTASISLAGAQPTSCACDLRCWDACPESGPKVTASVDYLLWWIKSGPVSSPLVAVGSPADLIPAALGQPGTRVVFGDHSLDFRTFSGVRFGAAFELSSGLILEGNYFVLERRSANFHLASDANGNPLFGIPFFDTAIGRENAYLTANPDVNTGPFSGANTIAAHTRLQGWEINFASQRRGEGDLAFKGLAGFRALDLNEDLITQDQLTPLAGGVLTFLGNPVPLGDTVADYDRFHVSNHFYGGQVGGVVTWQRGPFAVDVTGKIALGVNQEFAVIDGSSTLTTPAGVTTVPGGLHAQLTNIGHHTHNEFSFVPEIGVNLAWNITPQLKATLGYSFLYWTGMARPANQLDHAISRTLVPTDPNFGTLPNDGHPAFHFNQSDFWAQGISFGVEYRF